MLGGGLVDETLEHADDNRHAHAVIGAERCAFRAEIFVVANQLDRIGERIVLDAVGGNAHHIHMRLQNRERHVLATVGGIEIGDDVADRIALDRKAQRAQALEEIFTDGFFVFRRAGDCGKRRELL